MNTVWTGMELKLNFDCQPCKVVTLSTEETREFEKWVMKRVRA